MSDTPEPTAEEKVADALPVNAKIRLQHTRICAGQSPAGGAVLCACGPAAYFPTSRPSQVAFNRAPARSSTTQAPVMPPSWIARTSAHAICKSGVMVRRLNYQCASHVGAQANSCRSDIISVTSPCTIRSGKAAHRDATDSSTGVTGGCRHQAFPADGCDRE